jgi:hypothetical protein
MGGIAVYDTGDRRGTVRPKTVGRQKVRLRRRSRGRIQEGAGKIHQVQAKEVLLLCLQHAKPPSQAVHPATDRFPGCLYRSAGSLVHHAGKSRRVASKNNADSKSRRPQVRTLHGGVESASRRKESECRDFRAVTDKDSEAGVGSPRLHPYRTCLTRRGFRRVGSLLRGGARVGQPPGARLDVTKVGRGKVRIGRHSQPRRSRADVPDPVPRASSLSRARAASSNG